ncbi:GNAT family acetyltransferase [Streptococcus pseudoporcinus]|uniref:GNAT family acetyltransferase n=1 Tax=Streptococcus pseudoporcinus TaxID=361101 RepID=A0A4U9Y2D4_9STRE|nr:N-acetyltransferase [Streptococcus pseudoporcinus]VTS20730.1 GNAT family acetyltransferase [Streptococcus pseudoporcinus]
MQKELSIDLVKDGEVAILRDLAVQTFTETFGGHNTEQQLQEFFQEAYSTEILAQELKSNENLVYFLRLNSVVIGYLKVNWGKDQTEHELEDSFEIQRIYILNQYQGRGFGNYLFNFALEKAYQSGKAWVWLGVWEKNLKVQSLYSKYGFKKFSEHSFAVGDLVDTDWLMKKSLK